MKNPDRFVIFKKPVLVLLIILCFSPGRGEAQAPAWTVNTASFQHTMTVVSFLSLDGVTLNDSRDKIGAFAGNQVRGVASPVFVQAADRYLAYLTIYGNTEGEQITFKVYDHASGKTADAAGKINFVIDGQSGNIFQAFSAANPALNNLAVVEQFGFTGITPVDAVLTEEGIDITVEFDQEIDALQPEYILSTGASLFLDRTPVPSATGNLDFSEPIVFSVRSQDESVLKTFTVNVAKREVSEGPFTCTNVVTANGDGKNDFWIVDEPFRYKDYTFKIFDVNGRILFQSTGYNNQWDGTYKGKVLDRGQYFYSVTGPAPAAEIKGTILVMH